MKNYEEIKDQVERIDRVAQDLPELDAYGNKYAEAVAAIKDVLLNNLDEDTLLQKYLGAEDKSPDFLMNMALMARDWLDGNMDEDLDGHFKDILVLIGT